MFPRLCDFENMKMVTLLSICLHFFTRMPAHTRNHTSVDWAISSPFECGRRGMLLMMLIFNLIVKYGIFCSLNDSYFSWLM